MDSMINKWAGVCPIKLYLQKQTADQTQLSGDSVTTNGLSKGLSHLPLGAQHTTCHLEMFHRKCLNEYISRRAVWRRQ